MRKKSTKIRKWQEEFANIDDRDVFDLEKYKLEKSRVDILGNVPKEIVAHIIMHLPTIPYHFQLRRVSATWNKFLTSDMIMHSTQSLIFSMRTLPKSEQLLSILKSYSYIDAKKKPTNSLKRIILAKYCHSTGTRLEFFQELFKICTSVEEFGLVFDTPLFNFTSFVQTIGSQVKRLDISGTDFGIYFNNYNWPEPSIETGIQEIICHFNFTFQTPELVVPKCKKICSFTFDNFDFLEKKETEERCKSYLLSIGFDPFSTPVVVPLAERMIKTLIYSQRAWKFVLSLKPFSIQPLKMLNNTNASMPSPPRYNISFVEDCLSYSAMYYTSKLKLFVLFLDHNIPIAQEFINSPSNPIVNRQQTLRDLSKLILSNPTKLLQFHTSEQLMRDMGDGHSFLSVAIHLDCSTKMCQRFLNHGCSVEDFIGDKNYGTTAVHLAARKGREDLLQLFIDRSPNMLNAFNGLQQTPLMLSCCNGQLRATKKLIQLGASLMVRDMDLNTPLHGALIGRHQDFAIYLIESYADKMDLNCYNINQESPLWICGVHGLEEAAFWLLMKGANPKGEYLLSGYWTKPTISPYDAAIRSGHWKLATMIKQYLK